MKIRAFFAAAVILLISGRAAVCAPDDNAVNYVNGGPVSVGDTICRPGDGSRHSYEYQGVKDGSLMVKRSSNAAGNIGDEVLSLPLTEAKQALLKVVWYDRNSGEWRMKELLLTVVDEANRITVSTHKEEWEE
jgi:hypothetical protein